MITCIWAEDEKGAIGLKGKLPWKLPNDMRFFKEQTTGKMVVMGRKTFEGMNKKPLPNRRNIILTRQKGYEANGTEVIHSLNQLDMTEDIMVIGGSEIYQLFLPIADRLVRTKIDASFEADAYFPNVNWAEWKLIKEETGVQTERDLYPHRFQFFERKK